MRNKAQLIFLTLSTGSRCGLLILQVAPAAFKAGERVPLYL